MHNARVAIGIIQVCHLSTRMHLLKSMVLKKRKDFVMKTRLLEFTVSELEEMYERYSKLLKELESKK
jgi:hypothetical protein